MTISTPNTPHTQPVIELTLGKYQAALGAEFDHPTLRDQLLNLSALLANTNIEYLSRGADYVVKLSLPTAAGERVMAVKVFKRQSRLKDWHDQRHKSKAERSFRAAAFLQQQGIGTPAPVAWLEHWQDGRLLESYYLCLFEPAICFRDRLAQIYREERDNAPLMDVLHLVASAVRAMHDAGFKHGDMGNQNILLPRDAQGGWSQPQFIDLNRCRIAREGITDDERGFDLSRIALPGAYRNIFKTIYWQHEILPATIDKPEQHYRKRFAFHQATHKWRHPLRYLKQRKQLPDHPTYPPVKDIWLWDDKSAQPMILLERKEKNRQRDWGYMLRMLLAGCLAVPGLIQRYRKLVARSYQTPVSMRGRIGVALHPRADYIEHELPLLQQLGMPPVLIRIGHHETLEQRHTAMDLVTHLHGQGVRVMLALLQDRQAILHPASWQTFLEEVIGALAGKVSHIEITHASNRVKWGVWSADEYLQLLKPALELKVRYPQIQLTGPACIDFEYLPVIAALGALPRGQKLAALSHLLYVDRRGAPEGKQGKFSTLEKCALLKALAQGSDRCEDKVIISEVNWPVKYTGIWSPIGCPYSTPKWRREEPGETEDDYANYMLRFLVISLCSGHVEQVFWWRLSAHGYGLVDDRDNFRPRPAFTALVFFQQLLGDAEFVRKLDMGADVYAFEFHTPAQKIVMLWTDKAEILSAPPINYTCALDRTGEELGKTERLKISSAPIYLLFEHD